MERNSYRLRGYYSRLKKAFRREIKRLMKLNGIDSYDDLDQSKQLSYIQYMSNEGKLIYKSILHPEIYNSNLPVDQMLTLQDILENKHKGDFKKLLEDIMWYSAYEVEDYEKCAIIRDYINEI